MLKKKNIIILVLAIAVAGYFFVFKKHDAGQGAAPAAGMMGGAMPAAVASVITKEVDLWSEFSGRLEATDKVEIRPRVGGTIEKISFQEGSLVKKGDTLFVIDQRQYMAELNRAEANYASAKTQSEFAANEFERAKTLVKTDVITQSKFDERQSAKISAESNLKSAEASLNLARLNVDYSNIKAPISGRISRAEITEGNLVNPAAAPILATIVSIDPIYGEFNIDEQTYLKLMNLSDQNADVSKVPVEINLADNGNAVVKGVMRSFDNQLDIKSGTIRARAVFANSDGKLIPGLFAKIRLGSAEKKKAVLITDMAIGTDQDKKFVLAVNKENKIEYRPVTLGPSVDGLRVIESGLNGDEKIIVTGLFKFRPDMTVIPQEVPMEGTQGMAQEVQESGAKTETQKLDTK